MKHEIIWLFPDLLLFKWLLCSNQFSAKELSWFSWLVNFLAKFQISLNKRWRISLAAGLLSANKNESRKKQTDYLQSFPFQFRKQFSSEERNHWQLSKAFSWEFFDILMIKQSYLEVMTSILLWPLISLCLWKPFRNSDGLLLIFFLFVF